MFTKPRPIARLRHSGPALLTFGLLNLVKRHHAEHRRKDAADEERPETGADQRDHGQSVCAPKWLRALKIVMPPCAPSIPSQ